MNAFGLAISLLSLAIWLGLWLAWGKFWRADQLLEDENESLELQAWPTVAVVIPARNEADLLPTTLRSHFQQDYPGQQTVVLVDDHSSDGTAQVARQVAQKLDREEQLVAIAAEPLPPSWTGKLWALEQGTKRAKALESTPKYLLLTDADIDRDPLTLRRLVAKAERHNLSLVSAMVRLRCTTAWEQWLIPAFVFFFQKLYPFPWVNDANKSTAAAAGGCILIRRDVLAKIGGIAAIREALIDDCALAQAVKAGGQRAIWLGLSRDTLSLRPYPSLGSIWTMVARTAYTQLHYSPLLLLGTLVGMFLVYCVPPLAVVLGIAIAQPVVALIGIATWLLMARLYWPTLHFYDCPIWMSLGLPAIATLYTFMTLDSARRHWQGRGGAWKGRVYPQA